jgi:acetyltransferase-like isoleucine patch superfamily enzyme
MHEIYYAEHGACRGVDQPGHCLGSREVMPLRAVAWSVMLGRKDAMSWSAWAAAWRALRRRAAWRVVHRLWAVAQRSGLITAASPAGREFAEFGPGSFIGFPPGVLYGQKWMEIGAGTMIGPNVSLSAGMVPGQDLGEHPVLRIGDRCVIGSGSHVVAHASIVIGDDVYTGPNVYITDQNHGYSDPGVPIGRQWPANAAVTIGAGSWLGAGVIVLPGACIGRNVVVAAGSVVRGTVPDRCVIAGVPARVVREYVAGSGWARPSLTVGNRY